MTEWVNGKVITVKRWNEDLFSLFIDAKVDTFIAGQFAKIKIDLGEETIQRAYSYVNSPLNPKLEFYIKEIKNGKFSSVLKILKPNDNIVISRQAFGDFTINRVPVCENLWMISTGTAIGPYLSILRHRKNLEKFKRIILVHAVSFLKDFSYLYEINKLKKDYHNKLYVKIILSREKVLNTLMGYVQDLIFNGSLEISLGIKLEKKNSHVMLCGNPNMIKDTQKILYEKYNMRENFRNKSGHITKERYW